MGSVVSQVFLEVTAVMTEKGLATLRKGHSFCVVVLGVLPPERRQCSGRMAPEVWRRSTRRLSLDVFFWQQPVPHQRRGATKGRIMAMAPIPSFHHVTFSGMRRPIVKVKIVRQVFLVDFVFREFSGEKQ